MKTTIIGYPRVGSLRELKFASEQYFKGEISSAELNAVSQKLRLSNWETQLHSDIDLIPSNDFSFYDQVLDTAQLFNIIPERYRNLGLSPLNTYFAMARGYQGEYGDVKALAMKKWFNTNYHYMVPEIEAETKITLTGTKPFDEFKEAAVQGIQTRPVIMGAFTLLKLTRYSDGRSAVDFCESVSEAYVDLLYKFNELNAEWVQFDEPCLVQDLTDEDKVLTH